MNYHLRLIIDRWKLEREEDGTTHFFASMEEAVKCCTEYMGNHDGSLVVHHGSVHDIYTRFAETAELPC